MDIKAVIEWLATDSATTLVTIFPYLLLGLVGLYLLWLVLGYLRVSQVGVEPQPGSGEAAIPLQAAPDGVVEAPPGVPYCPTDHLQFPPGARFCTLAPQGPRAWRFFVQAIDAADEGRFPTAGWAHDRGERFAGDFQ